MLILKRTKSFHVGMSIGTEKTVLCSTGTVLIIHGTVPVLRNKREKNGTVEIGKGKKWEVLVLVPEYKRSIFSVTVLIQTLMILLINQN